MRITLVAAAAAVTLALGCSHHSQQAHPADAATDAAPGVSSARCPTIVSDPNVQQQLPAATVATDLPVQTGATTAVTAGDDLQAAIAAAQPGDTLVLAAGASFASPIQLPAKSGDGWIVIRTSTPDSALPPGTRVTPADAAKLALVGPITVAPTAGHYRLIGLEVTAPAYVTNMIDLTVATTSADQLAHDIILDRLYVHAADAGGRRGVALNSAASAVIDSYVTGFREMGADSQAIAGWTGPGPYLVANDYLEGASENLMFGGSDPSIASLVPSDIQICGNHLAKDLALRGGGWVVKNLFELKNARRVVVAGNVIEYNWADAQVGFAVLFTPRNQDGTAPWSGVQDATFAYNIVRHTGSGLNLLASDNDYPSLPLARIVIHDNLFDDIDSTTYGGDGRAYQFVYGAGGGTDILLDHNTTTTAQNAMLTLGDTAPYGTRFSFTNNIAPHGTYGVFGSGQSEGTVSLDYYLISPVLTSNAIFGGGNATAYPTGNFFPATRDDVGFAADYSLAPTSAYVHAGSDGKDLGADIAAITAATSGAL